MRRSLAALEQVEIARPDFLALGLDMLPSARADLYRAKGMPVIAWTVRSPEQWEAVSDHCDNLIFEGFEGVTSVKAAVRVHREIAEIGREAWDACAAPTGDPFVSYDFLSILEESGCVAARTGWAPQHLSVEDEDGAVAGVMPLYLKSHSQGEYVFDHSWADAYERAGGRYYPKLQCSSPFSPVTGSRLIVRPDVDVDDGRSALLGGALTLCERMGRLVAARDLSQGRRMGMDGPARTAVATGPAVSLGKRRLRDLRRLPDGPVVQPPQDHPSRNAATPRTGWRSWP